jgi:hypothetical protein
MNSESSFAMRKTAKRRSVSKLMSKSVNVFNGEKSLDDVTFLESPLEADLCYHLEFDCNVIEYQAQPKSFEYFLDDELHSYSPDFEVFYSDGTSAYIEVKFKNDISRISDFDKWKKAITIRAKELNKAFFVLTEEFIRQKWAYENLITIYCSRKASIDNSFLLHIVNKLDELEQATIGELMLGYDPNSEFEQVYRLIFEQKLVADINRELLSKKAVVKLNGGGYASYI